MLEWREGEFEQAARAIAARLEIYLQQIESGAPFCLDQAEAAAREMREPFPEQGSSIENLLDRLFAPGMQAGRQSTHPRYLAYVPGGALPDGALADLIGGVVNRFTGLRNAAPAMTDLETTSARHLASVLGMPAGTAGYFCSGGSSANASAIVAARERAFPGNEADLRRGRIYMSEQAHHSLLKGVRLAGFPGASAVLVPTSVEGRVDLTALESAIARDRAEGLAPVMVVGNAGNVNTGTIDPLAALAALARRERIWFHVDGAYGGCFALTPRGRERLSGMEQADSVTLDPHKGLFLPFGTGCLLVRDIASLAAAHTMGGSYLHGDRPGDSDPDICNISPELSRPFRGLRVWLALHHHGLAAFRDTLAERMEQARHAAETLRSWPHVTLFSPPELSLFAFRDQRGDDWTRGWLDALTTRGEFHLSGTRADGHEWIRICALNFRLRDRHIEALLEELSAARPQTLGA